MTTSTVMRPAPPPHDEPFSCVWAAERPQIPVDTANNSPDPRSPRPMPRFAPRRQYSPHAFTMIELLVAIGIIALLAGIFIYALKHITTQSKAQATKLALENLK